MTSPLHPAPSSHDEQPHLGVGASQVLPLRGGHEEGDAEPHHRQAHGGDLRLVQSSNEGSVFELRLPC